MEGVQGNVRLLSYGSKGNMSKDWGKPCYEHFRDRAVDWTEPPKSGVTRHCGQCCILHTCHVQLYRNTLWWAAGIRGGKQCAGEVHQDFHVRPPLLHSVPATYELLRVCRSLAAETECSLSLCETEEVREFTQTLQVLLLFHKWENGGSEGYIWPSSNRYKCWDAKLVLSGFEIYSLSTLSYSLLGNQLPRLQIQTYISKLAGSHEPSETGLSESALSLKVKHWPTSFFSKVDTGSLNPPSTLPQPVPVTFHFPFTWVNIQMIISEVQWNFQEELLISLNNIFFLQKKTISLLTDIKWEKMFLAYAQISANSLPLLLTFAWTN